MCGSELLVIRQTHCSHSKKPGGGKLEIWTSTLAHTKTVKATVPSRHTAQSPKGDFSMREEKGPSLILMKIMSGREKAKEDKRGEKEDVENPHNSRNLHLNIQR